MKDEEITRRINQLIIILRKFCETRFNGEILITIVDGDMKGCRITKDLISFKD